MINSLGKIDPALIRYIAAEVPFEISGTTFYPFSTSHDAAESIGLILCVRNPETFDYVLLLLLLLSPFSRVRLCATP